MYCVSCRMHSVRLMDVPSRRVQCVASVPELGALMGAQSLPCPLLHAHSPLHLLLATFRLTFTVGKLHKAVREKVKVNAFCSNFIVLDGLRTFIYSVPNVPITMCLCNYKYD